MLDLQNYSVLIKLRAQNEAQVCVHLKPEHYKAGGKSDPNPACSAFGGSSRPVQVLKSLHGTRHGERFG